MNRPIAIILSAFIAASWMSEAAEAASVTSQVTHKVMRSDGSRAGTKESHEFNGGHRLFFKSLNDATSTYAKKVGLKGDYAPTKKGWIRLYLDWPIQLNSIVIHKASVGQGNFHNGQITLEIQNLRGKWVTVFERKNSDIDSPITIRNEVRRIGPVKGARIIFRSPQPITIGPIDLNG